MTERLAPGMRPTEDVHADAQRALRRALPVGGLVLDVGCGDGTLLRALRLEGFAVAGVEISADLVARSRAGGIDVRQGVAEELPFAAASVDAIVCSVVMPYTDQRRVIREFARVVRAGGIVNATYHGLGYGAQYLLSPPSGFKHRAYGARMIVNTGLYLSTGRRLPGFIGDTICQTMGDMGRSYARAGFTLEAHEVLDRAFGLPRIIYHGLRRGPAQAT
jgi:SAM-dependent methyltransferase